MEAIDVAKKINLKIIELDKLKEELPILAQKKSHAMVDYELDLSQETLTSLSNGIPTTVIDKIAKGKCAVKHGELDLAESMYKNCLKIIDITEAQLNGYQSINRYLSEL